MATNAVEEIGDAVRRLTPVELQEFYAWLDQYDPQPIDIRLAEDLAEGKMDRAILRALDDESKGLTRAL